jgi:hypothetical protein
VIAAAVGATDLPPARDPLRFAPLGLRHLNDYVALRQQAEEDEETDPQAFMEQWMRGLD